MASVSRMQSSPARIITLAVYWTLAAMVTAIAAWITMMALNSSRPVARFPLPSGVEVRVFRGEGEPMGAGFLLEVLRNGKEVLPRRYFHFSGDIKSEFVLISSPASPLIGISRHPHTNHVLAVADTFTGNFWVHIGDSEAEPLIRRFQETVPGRPLSFPRFPAN